MMKRRILILSSGLPFSGWLTTYMMLLSSVIPLMILSSSSKKMLDVQPPALDVVEQGGGEGRADFQPEKNIEKYYSEW